MTQKFTKLNIGDIVATTGNRMFKKLTFDYTVNGVWKFNDTLLEQFSDIQQNVTFISRGIEYNTLEYSLVDDTIYYGNTTVYASEWNALASRVITFTDTQIVSEEFYDWLIANAIPYMEATEGLSYSLVEAESSGADYDYYACTGIGSATDTEIVIAMEIDGIPVTKISNRAFYQCTTITSVLIPDNITAIGQEAFGYCENLEKLTLPNHITEIGYRMLYRCSSLKNIVIPDQVTTVGDYAFQGCSSLEKITIPKRVTSLGDYAFAGCFSLAAIEIGENVTKLGKYSFRGCTSLTHIVLPHSVTSIGNDAFSDCTHLASIDLGNSVTTIGNNAFRGCYRLVEVINHSNLNIVAGSTDYGRIAEYAIAVHTRECRIWNNENYLFYSYGGVNYLLGYAGNEDELVLPDSYNTEPYEIYTRAFYDCTNIVRIVIPQLVINIGEDVFYGCTSLTSIDVVENNSVYSSIDGNLYTKEGKVLMQYAVGKQDLTFTIPDVVESISNRAFFDCYSLTSVTIPDRVTSIGEYAFAWCHSLTSVIIPDSVTTIGKSTFDQCYRLRSVTIGNSVTYISDSMFSVCECLTSVVIPDGVTDIGDSAFIDCVSLASVTIPASVTHIGQYAFNGTSLTHIYYCGTMEQWRTITKDIGNDDLTAATIHCNYVTNID